MDNLLTIAFEAHNPAQNHHRRYEITVGRDLLNDWTVGIFYGRCGSRHQAKQFASAKADDMRALVRSRLIRRLSAPKRIGCPYRLSALSSAKGIDPSAWIPGDVMAKFFLAD